MTAYTPDADVDVSQVKAGRYELLALRWDEVTSSPREPYDYVRHHQGEVLDLNAADARRLVAAGAVRSVEDTDDVEDTPGQSESTAPTSKPGASAAGRRNPTIEEILAEVGDDKAKAAEVLDYEQSKGEKARPRLIAKLQAVLDAPGDDDGKDDEDDQASDDGVTVV